MNRCIALVMVSLIFSSFAHAFSRSYSETGVFSNRSMSFKQMHFEALVKKLSALTTMHLHEFRDYSYPEAKLEAHFYCDSSRKSTTAEQIAKADQERVDRETDRRQTSTNEYLAKTPRYMSALRRESFVNSQCSFRLTWSTKDPLVRVDWFHWNTMSDSALAKFHDTKKRTIEMISNSLFELTKERATWTSSLRSGIAD